MVLMHVDLCSSRLPIAGFKFVVGQRLQLLVKEKAIFYGNRKKF